MAAAKPGEVWMENLGRAAKMRSCLMITPPPHSKDLDVFTLVSHTTAVRGNRWGIFMAKPLLDRERVFDVQRLATVASVKLERQLGSLNTTEMDLILERLAEPFGI